MRQELDSNLQAVFPTDDKYTYVIESYQSKELGTFPGAPGFAFETQVRINLKNEGKATEWLEKMQQHSRVTYGVTTTTTKKMANVGYFVNLSDIVNTSENH